MIQAATNRNADVDAEETNIEAMNLSEDQIDPLGCVQLVGQV